MNNAQLINQTSHDFEYYTQAKFVEPARRTMGWIELDPASSLIANRTIRAQHIYTVDDDALSQAWRAATLWLNHPFGESEEPCKTRCTKKRCPQRGYHIDKRIPGNADWINKLIDHYRCGDVKQACCITFASTSEAWFKPLMHFPQVYLSPRTNYLLPDGTLKQGVTKGSVITYLGPHVQNFAYNYQHLGSVMIPVHMTNVTDDE
jgi:hypothetical protein